MAAVNWVFGRMSTENNGLGYFLLITLFNQIKYLEYLLKKEDQNTENKPVTLAHWLSRRAAAIQYRFEFFLLCVQQSRQKFPQDGRYSLPCLSQLFILTYALKKQTKTVTERRLSIQNHFWQSCSWMPPWVRTAGRAGSAQLRMHTQNTLWNRFFSHTDSCN